MVQHNKGRGSLSSWQILWVLALLAVVTASGIFISQQLLLDNARAMGKDLVTSYSKDEDRSLNEYKNMVSLGMAYLSDLSADGAGINEIAAWIEDYFNKNGGLLDISHAHVCVVVQGRLISSNGFSQENVGERFWYQQAIERQGEVIFTDTYFSTVYNESVIAVASADPGTGNAIAVILPSGLFQKHHSTQDLPAGGA